MVIIIEKWFLLKKIESFKTEKLRNIQFFTVVIKIFNSPEKKHIQKTCPTVKHSYLKFSNSSNGNQVELNWQMRIK